MVRLNFASVVFWIAASVKASETNLLFNSALKCVFGQYINAHNNNGLCFSIPEYLVNRTHL